MEKFKIENYQKTIEEQARKIETYKTKFKDVVEAYKNLIKEKSALEASLNALTSTKTHPSDRPHSIKETKNQDTSSKENIDQESELSEASDPNNVTGESNGEEEANTSSDNSKSFPDDKQQKLDVLTSSLMTLTQQKSKMETNWVAERKQYKIDLEEKDTEIENLLKQIQQSENDIGQWRGKLRTQQSEHSRQQEDCNMMIKELQSLLNTQKMHNEDLNTQIKDMKMETGENNKSTSVHVNAILEREKLIKCELNTKKDELREMLVKTSIVSPQIPLLKQQLAELKEKATIREAEESRKIQGLESRLKEVAKENETRVHGMETKVLQLSEVLGEVERNKKQHQDTLHKLRDKNAQLDLEIATLTSLARLPDLDSMLNDLNNHDLYNKTKFIISKLKERNYDRASLYELVLEQGDLHKQCKSQLEQVQEEFERYKLRAQSVLKNKSKESNTENETVKLKSQISELKDRITNLYHKIEMKEQELKSKEENFSMMLKSLEGKHSTEIEKVVAEMRQKVCNMEGEMKRQRDRTVSMLADKEQEVTELRCRLTSLEGKPTFHSDNEVGASSAVGEDTSMTVEQLLSSRAKDQMRSSDRILHFSQEKAMMEGQISTLRKEKYYLENELKELGLEFVRRESRLEEEVVVLKEEVRRGDRASRRESANLEYLKNIVFQYMLARDSSSKQQIAKAISTILQFSPSEKNTLYTRKGWSPLTS